MANNTIMTAKNTFGDGLLMDFAPDNTQATCLTHALNATLVTMNGNELSLLNDMGNGRVETAYLPEGYVPVGTCEFGGIIYIVSYNPIINKSQIGCFPSPERNISSEEIGGTGCSFSAKEFVDSTGKVTATSVKKIIYSNNLNPGDKFIVYTNPIEKTELLYITDVGNKSHILGKFPKNIKFSVVAIEDSGKINYLNSDLKWYKDYYINTSKNNDVTKNPDIDSYRNLLNSGYSVFLSKISGKLAILAELETVKSFDTLYLIFLEDKYIEPKNEEIANEDEKAKGYYQRDYHIYLSCNWTSDNPDIYPKGIKFIDGVWSGEGTLYNGTKITESSPVIQDKIEFENSEEDKSDYDKFISSSYSTQKNTFESKYNTNDDTNYMPRKIDTVMKGNLPSLLNYVINKFETQDDKYGFYDLNGTFIDISNNNIYNNVNLQDSFVHNYFNKDVLVELGTISIPIKLDNIVSDLTGLTYTFSIAPEMSYGYLPDLKQSHTIDFGKIGTGIINVTEWRYYNNDNISTIKVGLEAYPEENKGILKIDLEFYDNQGHTATLTLKDKNSYSGTFTETIALNSSSNANLLPSNAHKGLAFTKPNEDWDEEDTKNLEELVKAGIYIKDDKDTSIYYENDSGIIYPNLLYLVKIKVYYLNKDTAGNFIEDKPKEFYRWYWTNSMFNLYYYDYYDFDSLYMDVNINVQGLFKENENFKINKFQKVNTNVIEDQYENLPYYSLGYNLHQIDSNIANVNMKLIPFVENSYDTFAIDLESLSNIKYTIIEGKSYITNFDESLKSTENAEILKDEDIIKLKLSKYDINTGSYEKALALEYTSPYKDWAESLKDWFTLNIMDNKLSEINEENRVQLEYININNELCKTENTYPMYLGKMSDAFNVGINMKLNGMNYQKVTANEVNNSYMISVTHYKPIVSSLLDLNKYNINTDSKKNPNLVFNTMLSIALQHTHGHANGHYLILEQTGLKFGDEISFSAGNKVKLAFPLGDFINANAITGAGRFGAIVRHVSGTPEGSGKRNVVRLCSNTSGDTKTVNSHWQTYWGCMLNDDKSIILWDNAWGDGEYLKYKGDKTSMLSCSTAELYISTIDNKYRGMNVFYRQAVDEYGYITLTFTLTTDYFDTMANIIASTLSRIYYKDPESISEPISVLTDVVSKINDLQTWKKEFIISLQLDEELKNMLTISNIKFSEYLGSLLNTGVSPNLANVTISEDEVTNKANVILFQYQIPYNVKDLLNKYLTNNIGSKVYLDSDITKQIGGLYELEIGNASDILYINNSLKPQSTNSGIKLLPLILSVGEQTVFKYSSTLSSIALYDIMKELTISDGECYAKLSYTGVNAYINSYSSDDYNERLGLGFDLNLKINSNFSI